MTREEVEALFIQAAEIDRRLPNTARPAKLKAQFLPIFHDWTDQLGWGEERYKEEREQFWSARQGRVLAHEVTLWEKANDLMRNVTLERNRRALWAWAKSKAGGKPFIAFCRAEGISKETGRDRKNRAVRQLAFENEFSATLDSANENCATLPNMPEMEHKFSTLATDANKRGGAWRDPDTEAARDTIIADWRGSRTAWRRTIRAR